MSTILVALSKERDFTIMFSRVMKPGESMAKLPLSSGRMRVRRLAKLIQFAGFELTWYTVSALETSASQSSLTLN